MTKQLGLTETELFELMPTAIGQASEIAEQFALIAWSTICEPGDGLAGLLVEYLGAKDALQAQIEERSSHQIEQELLDAGCDFFEIEKHGDFQKAISDGGQRWKPRLKLLAVKNALQEIARLDGTVITRMDQQWPEQLKDLKFSEPFALWVRGSVDVLASSSRSAAIVGCRGASSYGEYVTGDLVQSLVANKYAVISGGAYGIDAMAHRAALALKGETISVMAGGLDSLYPSGNKALLQEVIKFGAVIAEVPPGVAPTKWRFLQRNRLIAALAQSVTVVEANWRSGSINTVNHATEIYRKVFAVPGAVTSPKSAGTNRLIAEGRAELLVDGRDLVVQLGESFDSGPSQLSGLGALETRALDAIGFASMELSEICNSAGLTRDEARIALGSLELDGIVVRRANAWVRERITV